jgi:purine-binding chemotaxis protein CheW
VNDDIYETTGEQQAEPEPALAGEKQFAKYTCFLLSHEEYGIDIQQVQEILRPVEITEVPNTPVFILGVINLRGNIVPIIDLRKQFDLPAMEQTEHTRIIILDIESIQVGVMVDRVSEVLDIYLDHIEPPPPSVAGIKAEYLTGVGRMPESLVILLDIEKIVETAEQRISEYK